MLGQNTSKSSIKISIKIDGLKEGRRYKLSTVSDDKIDSSIVKEGALQFSYAGEPAGMTILPMDANEMQQKDFHFTFWSDDTDIRITGKASDPASIKVEGSEIFTKVQSFSVKLAPLNRLKNEAIGQQDLKKADSVQQIIRKVYLEEVMQHKNTYFGIVMLYYATIKKILDPLNSQAVFGKFDLKLQGSEYGALVQKLNQNDGNLTVGKKAPGFEQKSTVGINISLESFKGKYVLLEFWASNCSPCRTNNPFLKVVYDSFKSKGFEILGISTDIERKAWINAIKQDKLTWPQVSDLKGQRNMVGLLYNINAVPTNYLIGPDGIIIAKNIGTDALQIFLNTKLN